MRVLIYVEPHPIRGTLAHFADILKRYLPLLKGKSGLNICLFANDATFQRLAEDEFTRNKQFFLRSLKQEEEDFVRYRDLNWEDEGIATWKSLMAGDGDVTETYLTLLRRLWNKFPFDVIVHWGENGAITRLVRELPVVRVAMELGCTRAPFFDSIVLDPYGTNGSGIVPKLSIADIAKIVGNRSMSASEALQGFSHDSGKQIYSQRFERLPSILARSSQERLALLPLQLFDDANLLRFSPYNSPMDVVQDVIPKLASAGYTTVVKPHPASKYRRGSVAANDFALASLRPWYKNIIWCDETVSISNTRLLELCELVVTVNSSVGFEALFFDKPVVIMGDAVYKPKGLFPELDDFLDGRFNSREYQNNIGLLRSFMMGGYLAPDALCKEVEPFSARLGLIQHLQAQDDCNPYEFAHAYWRSFSPAQLAYCRTQSLRGSHLGKELLFTEPTGQRPTAPKPSHEQSVRSYSSVIRRLRHHWHEERIRTTIERIDELIATDAGKQRLLVIAGIEKQVQAPVKSGLFRTKGSPISAESLAAGAKILANLDAVAAAELARLTSTNVADGHAQVDEQHLQSFRLLMKEFGGQAEEQDFADWLDEKWADPNERTKALQASRIVDEEYYLNTYADVRAAGVDPLGHYSVYGILEGRAPAPHIPPMLPDEMLKALKSVLQSEKSEGAAATNLLTEAESNLRNEQLRQIKNAVSTSRNKIAVIAHLYYTDLVPELMERLKAIGEPFDLIATIPDFGTRRTKELVRSEFPGALFYSTPNRGRDIAPFLDLLPLLTERNYDAALKVQTKRGYYRQGNLVAEFGRMWREDALNALLGNRDRVKEIIDAFRTRRQVCILGPEPFLVSIERYPYHDGGNLAASLFNAHSTEGMEFFAGTMFWFRPSCLEALTKIDLTDFAPEDGANDGALAHLVERLFGHVTKATGGSIVVAPADHSQPLKFEPKARTSSLEDYFSARREGH